MNSDATADYLRDTLGELLERAREAKRRARGSLAPSADSAFAQGRAEAYYEVLNHLINQLDAFGIKRVSVGIDPDLDVTRELA